MTSKRSASQEQEGSPKQAKDKTKTEAVEVETIDRAKNGGHNRATSFRTGFFPEGELTIHTWMDADLRELADLVKQTQASARHKDAEMEFSLVFPDKRGMNIMRVVGTVKSEDGGPDDTKTLKQLKFQTGDYMDVAILLPKDRERPPERERAGVAPPPRGRGGAFRNDRDRDRDRDRGGRPRGAPWR